MAMATAADSRIVALAHIGLVENGSAVCGNEQTPRYPACSLHRTFIQ